MVLLSLMFFHLQSSTCSFSNIKYFYVCALKKIVSYCLVELPLTFERGTLSQEINAHHLFWQIHSNWRLVRIMKQSPKTKFVRILLLPRGDRKLNSIKN